MSQITISGKSFEVAPRYAVGHVLTANEASALNQTFFENLRNNFAKQAKDGASQADFDKYAEGYVFGIRSTGSRDPLQTEAMNIAREQVREGIRKSGKQLKAYTGEQITNAAAKLLERRPEILEIARERIAAMKNTATQEVDSDILADLAEAAPAPAPADGDASAEGEPAVETKRGKKGE